MYYKMKILFFYYYLIGILNVKFRQSVLWRWKYLAKCFEGVESCPTVFPI